MGSSCANLRLCRKGLQQGAGQAEMSKKSLGTTQRQTYNTENVTTTLNDLSRKDSFNEFQAAQKNVMTVGNKKLKLVTLKELEKHDSERSAWTSYKGMVYDVTKYLKKHPGGINKLLKGCGKQCDRLFGIYHQNVNAQDLLKDNLIGYLVKQGQAQTSKK